MVLGVFLFFFGFVVAVGPFVLNMIFIMNKGKISTPGSLITAAFVAAGVGIMVTGAFFFLGALISYIPG